MWQKFWDGKNASQIYQNQKKKEKHKKCNYDSSGRSGQRQQNEPQMCKAGNKKWLKYAAAIFIPAKVLRAYAA